MEGLLMENLTRSKRFEAGEACPRCGGLLILRDTVGVDSVSIEVQCTLCSRIWGHGTRMVYRPMPLE